MRARRLVCACLCGCMRVLVQGVFAARVCACVCACVRCRACFMIYVVVHRAVCLPAALYACVFACVFACVCVGLVARLVTCACSWCRLARAPHRGADRGGRQPAGARKFVSDCWFQRFSFEVQFWTSKMVSLLQELPSPTVPHNCIPSPLTDSSLSYVHRCLCGRTHTLFSVRVQWYTRSARCNWREHLALPSRGDPDGAAAVRGMASARRDTRVRCAPGGPPPRGHNASRSDCQKRL